MTTIAALHIAFFAKAVTAMALNRTEVFSKIPDPEKINPYGTTIFCSCFFFISFHPAWVVVMAIQAVLFVSVVNWIIDRKKRNI